MKTCPFCAEEIQDAAIKCRFCGEYLTAASPRSAHSSPASPSLDPSKAAALRNVGIWLCLLGVLLAGYFWLFFDTSVEVPRETIMGVQIGGQRVNNLGLMQEREMGMMAGSLMLVVGLVALGVSGQALQHLQLPKPQAPIAPASPESQVRAPVSVAEDAAPCQPATASPEQRFWLALGLGSITVVSILICLASLLGARPDNGGKPVVPPTVAAPPAPVAVAPVPSPTVDAAPERRRQDEARRREAAAKKARAAEEARKKKEAERLRQQAAARQREDAARRGEHSRFHGASGRLLPG